MTIMKKILTAMKTSIIEDPDNIPDSQSAMGRWYQLEEKPDELPDEVWQGPGVYLREAEQNIWHHITDFV